MLPSKQLLPLWIMLIAMTGFGCNPKPIHEPHVPSDDAHSNHAKAKSEVPGSIPFIVRVKTNIPKADVHIRVLKADAEAERKNIVNAYSLDCGNASPILENQTGDIHCIYDEAGEYDIAIKNQVVGLRLIEEDDIPVKERSYYFTDIKQWGNIRWYDLTDFAAERYALKVSATDIPDLSQTISLSGMFSETHINIPMNAWDVSHVKTMKAMFSGNKDFNQPLDHWNVSHVEDMSEMFEYATSFNQPLNTWDVSNVRDMRRMFFNARQFNQPLDRWNVKNVGQMKCMFHWADKFDQDISMWDFSGVEACLKAPTEDEMLKDVCIMAIFSYSDSDRSNLERYHFLEEKFPEECVIDLNSFEDDSADSSICTDNSFFL